MRVVSAGPRMELYAPGGRRRICRRCVRRRRALAPAAPRPPLRRGPHRLVPVLLAAGRRRCVRPLRRFRLVVDWHELWSARLLARVPRRGRRPDRPRRAAALPARAPARLLLLAAPRAAAARRRRERRARPCSRASTPDRSSRAEPAPAEPLVVFAGRHIPEKRVPALVPALALARERMPELRCEMFGDGPEREAVLRLRSQHGLEDALDVPGFVERRARGERARARALHAAAVAARGLRAGRGRGGRARYAERGRGRPGQRRRRARRARARTATSPPSAVPEDLAAAIERVHAEGQALRERTAAWFARERPAAVARELAREGARATPKRARAGSSRR